MKRISGMHSKLLAHGIAAIALVTAALTPIASAAPGDPVVQTAGNVSYVSGGVGLDSIAQLEAMARQFNLKLVFALKSGEYLSEVRVTIADAAGRTLLDTVSGGPWLLTKLPAGNYQIVATFAGKAEKRAAAVGAANLRTVDFRWASE